MTTENWTTGSGGTTGTGGTGGFGTGDTGAYETSTSGTAYDTGSGDTGSSDTGAKDKAKEAASTAADQGKQVAGTAKEEAANVAGTAKEQARNVVGETVSQVRTQVGDQATSQRDKLSETLRTLGDDLEKMVQGEGSGQGMAADLAREVSSRVRSISTQIESREPAELLDDVRSFARRKPGVFLLGALVAGVAVGRVFRATADGAAAASLAQPSTTDTYGTDYATGTGYSSGTGAGTGYAGGTGTAATGAGAGFSTTDDADPLFGEYASTDRPGTTGGDVLDPSPTLTTPASTDSTTQGLSGQRTQDTL